VILVSTRGRKGALLFVAAALVSAAVYHAQYALGLAMASQGHGIADVWSATKGMLEFHAERTDFVNPSTSRWYTWAIPLRPVTLRFVPESDFTVRAMTTLGNPLLWWGSTLLGTGAGLTLFWHGPGGVLKRLRQPSASSPTGFVDSHFEALTLLAVVWVVMLLPWILGTRDSYIWHYLPSYTYGLVILAGFVAWICKRRPWLGLLAVLAVAEVSVFYAPVWAQLPVSGEAYRERLFLQSWR